MFYENYERLCREAGEKPYALAVKLGAKNNSVVAQWKNGSVPKKEMLEKIAEHFGTTVKELVYGEEKQPAGSGELSEDEIKLLAAYRKILDQKKPGYLDMLERAAEHKE